MLMLRSVDRPRVPDHNSVCTPFYCLCGLKILSACVCLPVPTSCLRRAPRDRISGHLHGFPQEGQAETQAASGATQQVWLASWRPFQPRRHGGPGGRATGTGLSWAWEIEAYNRYLSRLQVLVKCDLSEAPNTELSTQCRAPGPHGTSNHKLFL